MIRINSMDDQIIEEVNSSEEGTDSNKHRETVAEKIMLFESIPA